jgi:hypothetical protein
LRASLEEEYIMRGCASNISTGNSMPHAHSRVLPRLCTHVLRSIIRHPADESDLAALALAAGRVVLDVVDGVAAADALVALAVLALGADELLAESVVVGLGGLFLDDNLLPVVGDLEDDPLEALAELELVEGGDALGSDGYTVGRRRIVSCSWAWGEIAAGDVGSWLEKLR